MIRYVAIGHTYFIFIYIGRSPLIYAIIFYTVSDRRKIETPFKRMSRLHFMFVVTPRLFYVEYTFCISIYIIHIYIYMLYRIHIQYKIRQTSLALKRNYIVMLKNYIQYINGIKQHQTITQ